jgi:hypothetical protein
LSAEGVEIWRGYYGYKPSPSEVLAGFVRALARAVKVGE